jgi:hypothetical protein
MDAHSLQRWSAYSAVILALRITLHHFSVSSRMSLPKSAGEPQYRAHAAIAMTP